MSYCTVDAKEASEHKPTVVFVDDNNHAVRVTNYEKHGKLEDM
jgi:aspartate 1-decarboxylase